MLKGTVQYFLFAALLMAVSVKSYAEDVFQLEMYFGLSIPSGGSVSLAEWESFLTDDIAKTFTGFNVVDSVGFYKDNPERSKLVTIIVPSSDIPKAKALAARYAKQFHQDSVMIVKVPVLAWDFIGADYSQLP